MEGLPKEAEEAAQKGEQSNVYKITKLICGKYSGNRNVPIRDKRGQLLTSEKDQEARWVSISRKSSTDQHQKRSLIYQKLRRT